MRIKEVNAKFTKHPVAEALLVPESEAWAFGNINCDCIMEDAWLFSIKHPRGGNLPEEKTGPRSLDTWFSSVLNYHCLLIRAPSIHHQNLE